MANGQMIIEDMLARLAVEQAKTEPLISADDPFQLPRIIQWGDGATMQISKVVDDLISDLAGALKQERDDLRKAIKQDEWRSLVRRTIGASLARASLMPPHDEAAAIVLQNLKAELRRQLPGPEQLEYVFGSTLFSCEDLPPFSVGPVLFERRADWAARKVAEGRLSPTTRNRLEKAWSGTKLRARKVSEEAHCERDLLDAIADAPYVITVQMLGYASDAGQEAAATAARLGLTSVALLWRHASKALEGFHLRYDPPIHRRVGLVFGERRLLRASHMRKGLPFGPSVEPQTWEELLFEAETWLSTAGDAIAFLISPDDTGPRPEIFRALSQALLWFNAGCREESDAFAIVNFAASMDALCEGKGDQEILRLLQARLGVKPNDPINPKGASFKSVIDQIYKKGRSRTVHGTSLYAGHDRSVVRRQGEDIARFALVSCLDLVGDNPSLTEVAQLREQTISIRSPH